MRLIAHRGVPLHLGVVVMHLQRNDVRFGGHRFLCYRVGPDRIFPVTMISDWAYSPRIGDEVRHIPELAWAVTHWPHVAAHGKPLPPLAVRTAIEPS